MKTASEFIARRKPPANEFFPSPGSRRTVLLSSHAPWTELIAYALWKLGYNVLVAEPWSGFFGEDQRFLKLDNVFRRWVETLRKFNVQLVIGGDDTALLPHPKTKEPLHRAAGVPAVNYWAREPRATPAMSARGYTAADYLTALRDARTLNVFWDVDVMEEVRQFLAVDNVAHVPLAATPELWQAPAAWTPVQDRPTVLSFAGDFGSREDWRRGQDPDTIAWAQRVANLKLAEPARPMVACVEQVGGPGESRGSTARRPYELAPALKEEFQRWAVLGGVLARDARGAIVHAAAARLGVGFVLQGTGWEHAGLRAAVGPEPGDRRALYARSRASLNPLDGGVHGGLPFRAYEIACSGGLLFTQHTRELPDLFEPGRECVAFRDADEMLAALDRLGGSPQDFNAVAENGRRRATSEHTWERRMARVLQLAKERFDLPW